MIKQRNFCLVLAFVVLLLVSFVNVAAAGPAKGGMDEVKLIADNPEAGADFGRSVAIDGNLVAVGVGADGADGTVYLYRRAGKKYVLETPLTCPDDQDGAEFGRSVAIKGNMVIVGARFADVSIESDGQVDVPNAGAVYIFKKQRRGWQFKQKINPPVPDEGSNFGRAIALQGDLLIVTARKQDSDPEDEIPASEDDGTAYAYAFKDGIWTYQTEIVPDDVPAGGAYFGQSVALQGDLMAIGARNDAKSVEEENVMSGAVYVFRHILGDWVQIARLAPEDGTDEDHYGFSVAMSGDTIAVGARLSNTDNLPDTSSSEKDAGAAYVYSVKENAVELVTKLIASDADKGDNFGQSIAMAGDVIAVGARRADIESTDDEGNTVIKDKQGAIYLFRRAGGEWTEVEKVTASDGMAGDEFGYSLAAFGNRMVTGAHFAQINDLKKAGAAYVIPLKP